MITIRLDKVLLHGYHGIHEEEKKVMNTFEVSLDVSYEEKESAFEHITETISYTTLYELLRERLKVPALLLEKICLGVIMEIKRRYPAVKSVQISIYKLQAPIERFQGKVGVTVYRAFEAQ